MSPAPVQAPATKGRALRWGDRGVSEQLIVQDVQDNVTPRGSRIRLEESGILSELAHHISGTATITPGTGTATKDATFGPYDLISAYSLQAGSNTPLQQYSGIAQGLLQYVEYPDRSWEANATPAGVLMPLADFTNVFNFPSATGTLRYWVKVPVALRWLGMPGGYVGYLILQNKKISNIWSASYNVSGAAAPYSLAGAAGSAPYQVTGPGTVTASPVIETWKTLHTVPDSRSKMPLYGFTRYIQEIITPYSGSSFKYLFEPGGLLLRAFLMLVDGGTTPVTEAQVSTIAFSYGTNRQVDVYTPFRNRISQLNTYGRQLGAGTYALDYYTANRNTVQCKSTENTANVQINVTFPSTYTPAANSVARLLIDKLYVVQNRVGA